ncbi:gag-pol polyprotein [Tanacetum coccineum]
MEGDITALISRCATCHQAKSKFHQGLYTLLPVPSQPWEEISMDFIVALPRTQRGKDAIMVVINCFSKMAHFVPCHKTDNAIHIADLFLKEIVRLYGVPKTIVSGCQVLKLFLEVPMEVAWTMVSKSFKDWDIKLPFVEFAYNRSPASRAPFEVNYGVNPLMPIDLIPFPKGNEVHFRVKTRAKEMQKIHEQVKKKIEHANDL